MHHSLQFCCPVILLALHLASNSFFAQSPKPAGATSEPAIQAEKRAIEFLRHEVPAWPRENGCFSCHNNGDGARALYSAIRSGHSIGATVLQETTDWLRQPLNWDENKGDPGFSDKRLANLQFALALLTAIEAGQVQEKGILRVAAARVAADQNEDGAWHIGQSATGSPATYGTVLATYLARKVLIAADGSAPAIGRAEKWLQNSDISNVPVAATLLLFASEQTNVWASKRAQDCLDYLLQAQTSDGGWGPFPDSPAEIYDTALALFALSKQRANERAAKAISSGRAFLAKEQKGDGSWPATTRPSGAESYAQRLSTTAWAVLALLATR